MVSASYPLPSATPVKIKPIGEISRPRRYDNKKINPAANNPPTKASSGRAIKEPFPVDAMNTTKNRTNKPDPELIPSVPGLAMSLRSKLCITTPAAPIPRPTKIDSVIRGRRKSNTIRFCLSVPFPRRTFSTSSGERFILPEFMLMTANIRMSTISTILTIMPLCTV